MQQQYSKNNKNDFVPPKIKSYADYLERKKVGRIFVHIFEQEVFPRQETENLQKKLSGLIANLDNTKNMYVIKSTIDRQLIKTKDTTSNFEFCSPDGKIDSVEIISGKSNSIYTLHIRESFKSFVNSCDSFVLFGTTTAFYTKDSMEAILLRLGMQKKTVKIDENYLLRDK